METVKKIFKAIATIWLLAFVVFGIYKFINGNSSSDQDFVQEDLNILESATMVGKSTNKEYEEFKTEGGLQTNSVWNGFAVTSIQPGYDDKNVLGMVILRLEKKGYEVYKTENASLKNISSKLSSVCSENWVKDDFEDIMTAKNGDISCKYEYPSSSPEVIVTIERSGWTN